MSEINKTPRVVVYDAKIRIIKQITTITMSNNNFNCCCLWCKDKNNKANHNDGLGNNLSTDVVVYDAKIRIIKQITTKSAISDLSELLLFMMQR